MVAMLGSTTVDGKKIDELIKEDKIKKKDLMKLLREQKRGAEIVKYLEKGSALCPCSFWS